MESKIRVAVDFQNGNSPCIELVRRQSEDVRDNLVGAFLELFPSHNRWARIDYVGEDQPSKTLFYRIVPITTQELQKEIELMQAWLKVQEAKNKVPLKGKHLPIK